MEHKILIIDDDVELCKLLSYRLAEEKIAVELCHNGTEGLQVIEKKEFELVVLDVMMPGINGFEVLERIRHKSNVPILMLTAKDDSASKIRGLRQGADDYLTKPFKMDEFIARVGSLIRRYTFLGNIQARGILEFDGMVIDTASRLAKVDGKDIELVGKEYDILLFCARNQGKILTKKQIYEEVWEEEYVYDDNTIMVAISRLRKKLKRILQILSIYKL